MDHVDREGTPHREETAEKIQKALESGGVEFIDENGGGPGVRLRHRQQKKSLGRLT